MSILRAQPARLGVALRRETVGGALLLLAAVLALGWANSPWAQAYAGLRDARVGPAWLELHLSLGTWAADGLLAVFFFVAGLELKRELVTGDLREPRRAALPVAAALGGMVVPALVYLAVNQYGPQAGTGALRGWAIPTATDIAFALAVLAVVGRHLPPGLRTFLLTLAVVDDLFAITLIAVLFTADLAVLPLLVAAAPLAAFTALVQRQVRSWWLLLPLAFAVWALVHASGVHATVAGVLLGFAVPVRAVRTPGPALGEHPEDPGRTPNPRPTEHPGRTPGPGLAEHFEHRIRPLSVGLAVPVFAFFSAGVTVGGLTGLSAALRDPVALGIIAGLVLGKTVGIFGATLLVARFTRADLDDQLSRTDVFGVSLLAGVGFTVSLLIGELAFGAGTLRDEHVKIGVLTGSLLAASLAAVVLLRRNAFYRRARQVTDQGGP